jgi:hypothetical protein
MMVNVNKTTFSKSVESQINESLLFQNLLPSPMHLKEKGGEIEAGGGREYCKVEASLDHIK